MAAVPIEGLGGIAPIAAPAKTAGDTAGGSGSVDFAETLASVITDASAAEKNADHLASEFAAGNPEVGIHETVIAAERANVRIRYAVTLKNKLLDAYRELMSTQV